MNTMSRDNTLSVITVVLWALVLVALLFDAAAPQLDRFCAKYAPVVEACRRN
jgi:hypothetical protein